MYRLFFLLGSLPISLSYAQDVKSTELRLDLTDKEILQRFEDIFKHTKHCEPDSASVVAWNAQLFADFNWIISFTKKNGFPNADDMKGGRKRRFISLGSSMNFTDITLARPEIFLTKEIITLFKKEKEEGRMSYQILHNSMAMMTIKRKGGQSLGTTELDELYELAMKEWEIVYPEQKDGKPFRLR